jgi:hypothetical protein
MTERYINFSQFDRQAISDALTTRADDARDVAFGAGSHVTVAGGKTSLQVFPAAGVARVTTDDVRIEVHRLPGLAVDAEKSRVVFEQGTPDDRTRLIVRSDGKVSLIPVLRAPEGAVTEQPTTPDANTVETTEPASARVSSADRVTPETGETEVVTLQGRLGRDPWFASNEDSPIAGFPLAVNEEQKTTWHKVVVFDETARQLHEQHQKGDVRKGRLVDVTGRPVVQEEQTPRGTKRRTEFHASQVSRVRAVSRPR